MKVQTRSVHLSLAVALCMLALTCSRANASHHREPGYVDVSTSLGADGVLTIPAKLGDRTIRLAISLETGHPSCLSPDVVPNSKSGTVVVGDIMSISLPVASPSDSDVAFMRKAGIQGYLAGDLVGDYSFGFDLIKESLRLWREPDTTDVVAWAKGGSKTEPPSESIYRYRDIYPLRLRWKIDGIERTIVLTTAGSTQLLDATLFPASANPPAFAPHTAWAADRIVWVNFPYGSQLDVFGSLKPNEFGQSSEVNGFFNYRCFASPRVAICGTNNRMYLSPETPFEHVVLWLAQVVGCGLVVEGARVVYDPQQCPVAGRVDSASESKDSKKLHGATILSINDIKVSDIVSWARHDDKSSRAKLASFVRGATGFSYRVEMLVDDKAVDVTFAGGR